MTARAQWQCPECSVRLTSTAELQEAARDCLVDVVRDHVATFHAATADLANARAQAGGWLAAAGHQVELWGGPHDGTRVWCPPGELPRVIGVWTTESGAVVPLRSALVYGLPGVDTYVLGIDGTGTTAADRYLWTP